MGLDKSYFASLRGKKVVFQKDSRFPDVRIQYVNICPDFTVRVAATEALAINSVNPIRYQEVSICPDIKLQKVNIFGDFDIFFR